MLEELKEALAPHVFEAVMSLLTLALGYATVLIRRWTGIQIEEKHMRALHSAIRNGSLMALQRGGVDKTILIGMVKDYVSSSVPDALKSLSPSDGVLDVLINAALAEIRAKG